ncbi:MAG TPA: TetR/AcrR family transcriptional regulator [Actinomycetes bacterium]|nr:TetR/AcrR family transcriptional regulator [Actinomycetes bacterium]
MSRSESAASPPKRERYHHGDLRRSLVQAGREVLAERGVDALTLREVARQAKVSQAAPYHHFANKADLVSAIAQHGFEDFAGALRAGAETAGDGALQRLTGMGLAYVRFAVANPELFRLLFRPELRGGTREGAAAEAMVRAGSAAYQVFLDAVTAAVKEGSVQGSVEDVAVAALSIVHGLSTLLVDGPIDLSQRPPDTLGRVVISALGAGITSRPMS